jgi:hypothetical protein
MDVLPRGPAAVARPAKLVAAERAAIAETIEATGDHVERYVCTGTSP